MSTDANDEENNNHDHPSETVCATVARVVVVKSKCRRIGSTRNGSRQKSTKIYYIKQEYIDEMGVYFFLP